MIVNFLKKNSFHDGYITTMKYCRESRRVTMNIVQLYSQLSIVPSMEKFEQDDLVEVELRIENVYDVSSAESDYSDYDIIDVRYEQKDDEDILLYQLHIWGGYKEIYIKGKNIRIGAQINKKADV